MARCYTPTTIKNPAFGKRAGFQPTAIDVPCGKCYACVQNKRTSWAVRLKEERLNTLFSYFITLTYDNEHLPAEGVKVSDIQDYMKSIRRLLDGLGLGKYYKLKYFCVSEYGSKSLRAHYHMILFNFPNDYVHELIGRWTKGFVHVSEGVGDSSMMYITKYMLGCSVDPDQVRTEPSMPKKLISSDGVLLNQPFTLMSKGLGRSYVARMKHWHQESTDRMYIPTAQGYKLTMPRYYRELLYDKTQLEERRLKLQAKNDALPIPTHDEFVLEVLKAHDASRKLKKQQFETKLKQKV